MGLKTKIPSNWILLRGLAREVRHWGEFPKLLKQNPHCQEVICLEIPGAGKKYQQDAPLSISEYVYQLRSEFLKIKSQHHGNWGIIGISMGGMMAMDWCHSFPEDFKQMVLINSSASNLCSPLERFSVKSAKEIGKLIFEKELRQRERSILKLTTNMLDISDELLDQRESIAREYPFKNKTFFKQIFAASHFRAPKKIKVPVLVLRGMHDRLASPSCSEKIAKHFGGELKTHPKAGHDLPMDDPNWIIQQIYP